MAARSLRAARATSDAAFRQTCFGVAAIYKRLALEDEILRGDRQRSGPRNMEQLLPQASLRSDDIPIVCEPGDSRSRCNRESWRCNVTETRPTRVTTRHLLRRWRLIAASSFSLEVCFSTILCRSIRPLSATSGCGAMRLP